MRRILAIWWFSLSDLTLKTSSIPAPSFPGNCPAEKTYDVGNKELLAVKVALEEWRHWLKGARQPFLVWTDHKNLEYIRSAIRPVLPV